MKSVGASSAIIAPEYVARYAFSLITRRAGSSRQAAVIGDEGGTSRGDRSGELRGVRRADAGGSAQLGGEPQMIAGQIDHAMGLPGVDVCHFST